MNSTWLCCIGVVEGCRASVVDICIVGDAVVGFEQLPADVLCQLEVVASAEDMAAGFESAAGGLKFVAAGRLK